MIHSLALQAMLLSKIHSSSFLEKHRQNKVSFTRKRSLSFVTVLSLILQKITRSLQIEANLLGDLLKIQPVTKQALSKARYKIGVSAFQDLHESMLDAYYQDNQERLWNGYRVFGGDGSTLALPRRGDIPLFFGDHFKRTCLGKIMQYTELTSDLIVAASLMPYKVSEEGEAKRILPNLVRKMNLRGQTKQIYVYDRGFPSHAFAQRHVTLGVNFLFRVQKTYSKQIEEIIRNRQDASFNVHIKRGPIDYHARVIIRYLESGEPLVLMTNFMDRVTDEELIGLYRMRWRCEESYKFQKTVLQMDNTYCRCYQGIAQEFWATVFLATLMLVSFNEEDDQYAKENPEKKTKANRRVVFGSLKQKYLSVLLEGGSIEAFNKQFKDLCRRYRVPDKPHRSFPRLSVDTRKTRHCYRRAI